MTGEVNEMFGSLGGQNTNKRYACVTNYESLYATGYFAHAKGVASFSDKTFVQAILKEIGFLSDTGGVLDIGGGNGLLGDALEANGVRCFTIDAQDRDAKNYRQFNLSVSKISECAKVKRLALQRFSNQYVATCFDVAEHIDSEHLPDFLTNLRELTFEHLLLSVSTRPSSMGNRYHSTVLPISTWRLLLEETGFEVETAEELEKTQSATLWSEATEDLWAASHWQRLNPFREHSAHQAYFRCRKVGKAPELDELRSRVLRTIDVDYRRAKRYSLQDLPRLVYHVSFWQDWSFLRSLMDVWPADRLHVIIRRSFLAEPYFYLLTNYLRRVNVRFHDSYTVTDGIDALIEHGNASESLFLSLAVDPHPIHLSAVRVALEARNLGFFTLTIQHGLNLPNKGFPGTHQFLVWGEEFKQGSPIESESHTQVTVAGSPKLLDAGFEQSKDAFAYRLGDWTRAFKRRVVVGLSLHWEAVQQSADSLHGWIERLLHRHPDTLFILKPHPDDVTVYRWVAEFDNVMVLDDIAMTVMDWPVARLLRSVDLLVTAPSTLVLDAIAAGTPVALFGFDKYLGPTDATFRRIMASCHVIEDELLPEFFMPNETLSDFECLARSKEFFSVICSSGTRSAYCLGNPRPPGERIYDWANGIMPQEVIAHWEQIARDLKCFVVSNSERASIENSSFVCDEYDALRKENAELRSALKHAQSYPWKYLVMAWRKRQEKKS